MKIKLPKIKRDAMKTVKKNVEKIMEPDIQIMMLGARRVGKTSILASIINEFNEVTKSTNLSLSKEGGAKAIDDALNTMKGYFLNSHKLYEPLTIDSNATRGFDKFDLRLDIVGKKNVKPRRIRFLDCAGEWINNYKNKEEIQEQIEKSSIIIIAIDSVLLMEKDGKFQFQNCAENVTNFIKQNMIPDDRLNKHKMILFIPLKCEKYFYQNKDEQSKYFGTRMDSLCSRVKEEYSDLFGFLSKPQNKPIFTVAILPILSLGGIEFFEFTDAAERTKEITSEMIQYCYCEPNKFAPKNCAQPLLYALMFEQKKIDGDYYKKAYKEANKKRFSAVFIEWLQDKKNRAKDVDYISELKKLEDKLVKNGDGYEIIQDPLGL